jgi:photosystem II stability/assembly factor-like uncharacterized protein
MKTLILTTSFLFISLFVVCQNDIQSILGSDINFEKVCKKADSYFEQKHPNLSPKDLARGEHRDGEFVKYMRWRNYWSTALNPDGTLGDFAAYHQSSPLKSNSNDLYDDIEWTNISNNQFIRLQISMGRTSALAFHPTDSNIFYVGAAIGGVWKTEDGGETYIPLGDDLPYLAVSSIVVDQENPDIIYVSLGNHVLGGLPSIGVYKSVDGGLTWGATGLTFPISDNTRIYWLAADPNDSSTILAATQRGLYKTTDGFDTFNRVTTQTCVQAHYKFGDSNVVYLGTNNGQFYKSTDGADSFRLIDDFGTSTVRIALTADDPDKVVVTHAATLNVSTDSGDSFPVVLSTPESSNVQHTAINPQDANDYLTGFFELFRSTDGGANYEKVFDWLGRGGLPVVHVDMRNTYVNPLQDDRVYFCHDGGVDAFNVVTGEFINLSDGLIITQFYDIGVSQSDPSVVSGGSQDNGSMYRDQFGVWDDLAGTGDGMVSEIDPSNEKTIYWEFQFGAMRRFNGTSNVNISPPGEDGEGDWITPYRLDPNNSNRIIVGYRNVYESLDQGNTWTSISNQLANGANLTQVAIAESNGDRVYAINGTNLFVKETDSNDWTTKRLPIGSITDLEVNPSDMDRIMITAGGYTDGFKVFSSDDGGDTWTNISGDLPNVRFGAVEYFRDIPNAVFIGSEAGVYYRDDNSPQWISYGQLPNTRINDIEIQYRSKMIRVGTFGRGVLEAPISIINCDESSLDQDNDGVCDLFDLCPILPDSLIGTPCDDGDRFSVNEAFSQNCQCEGGQANLDYCVAEGSAGTGADFIVNVRLNNLNSSSDKTAYSDFRSISADLIEDSTYTLSITLNFAFPQDTAFAWIDYNRNSTFDDDEMIVMSAFENNTSSGTFIVSKVNDFGATTLRVRSVFSGNPTANPCGSFFGEVEDYTVRLLEPGSLLVDLDQDGFFSDVDCDDENPEVNPNQVEEPYNGIDDDCNAATLDDDLDQDGFTLEEDCDDSDPNINPDAIDIPNNGIDEDCDESDMVTSIHILSDTSINIYPNPATDIINIDMNGSLNFRANIYNLESKLVQTFTNVKQIPVNTFANGLYLLEIQDLDSNQRIIERIVVGQ